MKDKLAGLLPFITVACTLVTVGLWIATSWRLSHRNGYDRKEAAIRQATVEACKPHDMVISERDLDCTVTEEGEIIPRTMNFQSRCSRCGIYSSRCLTVEGWPSKILGALALAKTDADVDQVAHKMWGIPDPEKKGKAEAHIPRRQT